MTGPSRMLLGAALLFWGAMTDRAVVGLVCALVVEGAHWTRTRWNFGDRATLMAWRLSVLLLLLAMVLVVMQGARLNAMGVVFTWLPVILLPLQFVQSYGISSSIPLGTFSMMIRRRKEHAAKYGLPFREARFNFGHVYFCATLLASCLGTFAATMVFYPVLVALVSWAFIAAAGRGWRGVGAAAVCALGISAGAGLSGQKGLSALYIYVTQKRYGGGGDFGLDYLREMQTSIGNLGKLKQSPEIKWRLIPEKGPLPRLLRVASYSEYAWASTRWVIPGSKGSNTESFQSPAQIVNPANPDDPDDAFIILPPELEDPKVAADPALPRFRLRGATPDEGLLPLPGDAAAMHGFAYEEFERNPFGTFRLEPSQPVADASVLWGPGFATELPPGETDVAENGEKLGPAVLSELQIPKAEAAVIKQMADEIGLREGTLQEKIGRLEGFFLGDFEYTRYNSIPRGHDPRSGETLLGKFLTKTRAGHCEFFATASTLLLREAGVPTRYVTGFAVAEFDREAGEALVRGTHAHAWCRAWNEETGRWIDVDLTPPGWTSLETRPSRYQALTDWFQRQRENFLVWRDQPGHMTLVVVILMIPMLAGLAYIGRNLWFSRSRLDAGKGKRRDRASTPVTPLATLEKPARRLLGERPPGMPLASWLRQLAPGLPRPEVLAEALDLHHRLRFDPAARDSSGVTRLESLVAELRAALVK